MDILAEGRRVFDAEIEALSRTREALDDTFVRVVELVLQCRGKVITIGMGKPGHIAAKLAATFASLGTPSFHLHPAEAMHGDLGMISKEDVVIVISYSGESDEIIRILPGIKIIGATIIGITGNAESSLAEASDFVQRLPQFEEACNLGLAPTSSTTAALCYGDAVAVAVSKKSGFSERDFGRLHPAGSLGKKLIFTVGDLMSKDSDNAVILKHTMLKDAVIELSQKGLGMVSVVDSEGRIVGVVTDGDLRRQLEKEADVYHLYVEDVMTENPITIKEDQLASVALDKMRERNISCMPVLGNGVVVGTIRLQAIISSGIIG